MLGQATFDFSIAMTNKVIVLWDVTPCSLVTMYGLSEELFHSIKEDITLPQFFYSNSLKRRSIFIRLHCVYPRRQ